MSDVKETAVAAGTMTDDHPSRYVHPDAPVWLLPHDRIIWSQGYAAALAAAPSPAEALPSQASGANEGEQTFDEGIDFALEQLCTFLNVDPKSVTWDAATETLDGDVRSVIGNIMRAKFGEDWSPALAKPAPAVEAVREALEEAEEALGLVEQPAFEDPRYGAEVRALGERIGYGALMSSASASWRKKLSAAGLPGGEFVAGPCHATVVNALTKIRTALAPAAQAGTVAQEGRE